MLSCGRELSSTSLAFSFAQSPMYGRAIISTTGCSRMRPEPSIVWTRIRPGLWSSKESIYVWYDSNARRLYFRDGSFWVFDCVSSGTEPDGGTRYPTVMEDSNGNQIFVRYHAGRSMLDFNSSARIRQIEDPRAVALLYNYGTEDSTYEFNFDAGPDPHLVSIVNEIGFRLRGAIRWHRCSRRPVGCVQ